MAKFYTAYGEKPAIKANEAGNIMEPIYRQKLDDHGNFVGIEATGEYANTWEMIQSYKDECDIHTILERAVNGDESGLNARKGIYIDASNIPSDFNDIMKAYKQAKITIQEAEKAIKTAQKKAETKQENTEVKNENEQKQ